MSEHLAGIYERYSDANIVGGSDKGTIHSYIPLYEDLLASYRLTARRVLEVGVFFGYSLRMWREYFPLAEIVGVDVADYGQLDHSRYRLIVGNSRNPDTFRDVHDVDVAIDDGDHDPRAQVATFQALWSKVRPGGIYVIEDIVNIDATRATFSGLHQSARIYDRRQLKGQADDVVVVFRKE